MNLPDMKGTDVIRQLKSRRPANRAYRVIITARSATEIKAYNNNADRMGVDEFVSKPIRPHTIRKLMSNLKPPPRTRKNGRLSEF
jgi:response regulator RpfG family c-di-GMP phosphodiesterase